MDVAREEADIRPGRLHHCMRTIGVASRALDLLLLRVSDPARKTFGKQLKEHGMSSLRRLMEILRHRNGAR